jgi:hypothetical protein
MKVRLGKRCVDVACGEWGESLWWADMIWICVEGIQMGRMAHGKGGRDGSHCRFQVERRDVDRVGNLPKDNANFAGVQHVIHHPAPQAIASFDFVRLYFASVVVANGSMSFNEFGAGDMRRAFIEADLVECMVALPGQPFNSMQNFSLN